MRKRASFTSMKDSTSEDWQLISAEFAAYARGLPDRVIAHLRLLEGDFGGFPVDRYTHSLQTATRAMRDGRDSPFARNTSTRYCESVRSTSASAISRRRLRRTTARAASTSATGDG